MTDPQFAAPNPRARALTGSRAGLFFAFAFAAALLAGCAMPDDKLATLLVAPGKYELYNCEQLATEAAAKRARLAELERLMATAQESRGGALVNTLGYRPDYLSARGELNDVLNTAKAKNCPEPNSGGAAGQPQLPPPPHP